MSFKHGWMKTSYTYWLETAQISYKFLHISPLGFLWLHTSNLGCHPGSFFCQILNSRYTGPSDTQRLTRSSALPRRCAASKCKWNRNRKTPYLLDPWNESPTQKAIEFISHVKFFIKSKMLLKSWSYVITVIYFYIVNLRVFFFFQSHYITVTRSTFYAALYNLLFSTEALKGHLGSPSGA